jgi:hypothetical protein
MDDLAEEAETAFKKLNGDVRKMTKPSRTPSPAP